MNNMRGDLLEYPEAVRACAMRRYPRNLGTIPHSYCFLSFFGLWALFYISLVSFCSLQYIVEILYCSYSSVCPVGTTGNLIFLSYLADLISTGLRGLTDDF